MALELTDLRGASGADADDDHGGVGLVSQTRPRHASIGPDGEVPGDSPRHRRWELTVVVMLFASWVACYFCRDHLFLVADQFQQSTGVSDSSLGLMMAFGYVIYPLGKVVFGYLTDRFGGRPAMIACIVGTAVASFLFSLGSSLAYFVAMWALLRLFQPAGWIGLVKLAGNWVPWQRQGRVMAVLSLSMMVGDVTARGVLSVFIGMDYTWQAVMQLGSGITLAIVVPSLILLKPDPTHVGLPLVPPNPHSRYSEDKFGELHDDDDDGEEGGGGAHATRAALAESGADGSDYAAHSADTGGGSTASGSSTAASGKVAGVTGAGAKAPALTFMELFRPIAKDPQFLLVCLLSFLFTAIRETFNTYSGQYLQSVGADPEEAAAASAIVPLAGVPSVFFAGFAFDKVPSRWRGAVVPAFLAPAVLSLFLLWVTPEPSVGFASVLLAGIGLGLLGPYSLLAGAFSLEIGGDVGAGLVSSIVDAAGYIGAMAMMLVRASGMGFGPLFFLMFVLSGASMLAGVALTRLLHRQ